MILCINTSQQDLIHKTVNIVLTIENVGLRNDFNNKLIMLKLKLEKLYNVCCFTDHGLRRHWLEF